MKIYALKMEKNKKLYCYHKIRKNVDFKISCFSTTNFNAKD